MALFVIKCRWQETKNDVMINGLAICKDPDTPVTFIYPDGKPYTGDGIWDYTLMHYQPWAGWDN